MQKIRVFRPAAIAALVAFVWGFSTMRKPSSASYGEDYLAHCILLGLGYSVIAFLITLSWKGFMRFAYTYESQGKKKAVFGLFSPIVSREEALLVIKNAVLAIVIISAYSLLVQWSVGDKRIGMLDFALTVSLSVVVYFWKSRAASVVILLLSIAAAAGTGYNRIYVGAGGANLLGAMFIVWISVRLAMATFRFHSYEAYESKPVAPESIVTVESVAPPENVIAQVAASPLEHSPSIEDRLSGLRDLFEKGLITQAVYEQRQAEILSEQ